MRAALRPLSGSSAALLAALLLFACTAATGPASGVMRPAELKGLRPGEVLGLLGEPDFRRSEPPAELWQYRAQDCILDLFFYYDAGAGFRVTDAETRERDLNGTGACRDAEAPLRAHLARTPL